MDSGNSGSMQSSTDGEEEYDSSHCAAVSYTLPPQSPFAHAAAFYAAPPPPPYFDPLAGFFEPPPRSAAAEIGTSMIRPPMQQPPPPPTVQSGGGGAKPARNPKKRLRASRRAPTTVLTTDTSNFRAMVQEFTGIPAPPFGSSAASSSFLFPRTRLDLFGAAANRGGGSGGGGSPLLPEIQASQLPSYLMRPFAAAATANSGGNAAEMNFQLPHPDLGLLNSMRMDLVGGGFSHPPAASSGGVSRGEKRPLSWAEELRLAADEGGGRTSGGGGNCNQQAIPADHGKGNGNATSLRCDGMLESWICSSTD